MDFGTRFLESLFKTFADQGIMVITLLVEATIPRLAKNYGKRRGVQGMYVQSL